MADLNYDWRTEKRDADDLSALHGEISSSVAAILRSVPSISPEQRPRLLKLASELLAAQSRAMESVGSHRSHSEIISQSPGDCLSPPRQCNLPISYVPHAHLDPIDSAVPSALLPFHRDYPCEGSDKSIRFSRETTSQIVPFARPATEHPGDPLSDLDRIAAEMERQFGTRAISQPYNGYHKPPAALKPEESEDAELDTGTVLGNKLVSVVRSAAVRLGAPKQASLLALAAASFSFWLLAGSPNGQTVGPKDPPQRIAALNEPLPRVDSGPPIPADAISTRGKAQAHVADTLARASPGNESQRDQGEPLEEPQTLPAPLMIDPPPQAQSPGAEEQSRVQEEAASTSRNASSEVVPMRKKILTLARGDQAGAANDVENEFLRRQLQKNAKSAAAKIDESGAFRPVKKPTSSSQLAIKKAAANQVLETASITPPAGGFAPVLLSLKDKQAALQIFADLKTRYGATLANKTAQLRSFNGPDGQTWYRVAALPPVTKEEAKAVCQSLGPEGEALDCAVMRE